MWALFGLKAIQLLAALSRCDELRWAVNSSEWEDMFILYCRRAASEDLRLARESNGLCADLTAVIEEREHFINKLDILVDRFWERSLSRAREKNLFIEKLKGNMESGGVLTFFKALPTIPFEREGNQFLGEDCFGRAVAPGLGGGVLVFQDEEAAILEFSFPFWGCSWFFTGCAVATRVGGGVPVFQEGEAMIWLSSLYSETRHELTAMMTGCSIFSRKKLFKFICFELIVMEGYLLEVFNVDFSSSVLASVGVSKVADRAD
ncbi:hypothetical protein Tco_0655407 [Tanacetum coccineum]|uniref:Uncharacterized protein n=1 Tax=Tanacetum coccineum TaxID=301880 RepID=A0ABQ4X6E9_9ASTR